MGESTRMVDGIGRRLVGGEFLNHVLEEREKGAK